MTDGATSGPDVYMMAFACEPGRGSEPGVGYVFAQALERFGRESGRRVVLVTRPHRVQAIQNALVADGGGRLTVLAVHIPALLVRLTGRRFVRAACVVWQWRATRSVRRMIVASGRDAVVHHVTFATESVPTFEGRLRDVAALAVGPAGSSLAARGVLPVRLLRAAIARRTLGPADLLIAQGKYVETRWRAAYPESRMAVEPNIVIDAGTPGPIEWDVACIGLLIPRKRVDLSLRAFAAGAPADARMALLGDGPLQAELEALAAELGVADRVTFFGWADRATALHVLATSKVLLHPSMREGSAWVVGEAQSFGCHPIAVRGSGADVTVEQGGIGTVVDVATPEALGAALAAALDAPRAAPSARWSAARIPQLLSDWYAIAWDHAAARVGSAR